MGNKERRLKNQRLLNCSENKRLIRINAGRGWTGELVLHDKQRLILKNPRPFHGVPTGWPDLIGWETIEITEEMVGQKIAIFCAEELKATGSLSTEQKNFKKLLLKMGGIFHVIR